MTLPVLSAKELETSLRLLGIEEGDGLLIHSALQFLGKPEEGEGMYLEVLQDILGSGGTIVVPAFNFEFAKGVDFDPAKSPSEGMGVFSELVRKHPEALRTNHPLQSLSILGAQDANIARRDTLSAFDEDSAFDVMLKEGYKLLLLGATIQAASIVHYSEQRASVPYRYWKDFTGNLLVNRKWEERSYKMFVRDLDIDAQLDLAPIQKALEENGQWFQTPIHFGHVSLCLLTDFVRATDQLLAEDPWALVANRSELKI